MSKRLTVLTTEIRRLRQLFLPDPFDPLGVYADSARVQAHTRAFLVLSHAEFESYFESWAKELAAASELVWKKFRRVTPPLAFLLSWNQERLAPPASFAAAMTADSVQRLEELVKKLFTTFYTRIVDNHGVKEANVLALFGPLGVPASAFSPTLLPNLDTLGSKRGVHAHHSAKVVVSVLDPETEFSSIQQLLLDLAVFDQWLTTYRKRIR